MTAFILKEKLSHISVRYVPRASGGIVDAYLGADKEPSISGNSIQACRNAAQTRNDGIAAWEKK